MSNQEILEKAIRKAIEGGYLRHNPTRQEQALRVARSPLIDDSTIYAVIVFNHDFAKALFGDAWQYHLQHMVIADDPIKYLGEHLG